MVRDVRHVQALVRVVKLTNCRNLTLLSLSRNPLNGMLPVSVGNLSAYLRKFYADRCKIKGRIPYEVGNLSNLIDFDLHEKNLVGSIPTSIGNLRILQGLFLSGSLPNCLGNITFIREIYLGSNKFSSNIPTGLGNLKDLLDLDLSSNNMVGSLPPEIGNLKVLVQLDLSMNGFSNEIPREIGGLRGKIAPQQADSVSTITRERISFYELLQVTDELSESNLIGSGSFGTVYKGILRSGVVIAVKVFILQLDAGFKSFDTECEVFRSLRHRNLVKVITSCSNLDSKAIVLEYMPNGSLEKYLYSHNYFLDIMQRLSIMIDVACALEYLHHGCSLPVIHCYLKPSNVLLDEDMVSHLSDFGISKLLGEDESDLYTKTLATLGYIAPEYGLDGLVSTKCDIYSYGIMLLETFTRRKPNDFEGDVNLKQWVSYSLPEAVMYVVDANLLTSTGNRLRKELDVLASIMKVAFDCCAESPARRTNMKDVVGMLQMTKIQLLECGSCSSK
ncbi:hypothetical protein T459_11500 [Capsicum annuum]|uniref:non-specific serine/threonine protein kinase n=1 Tax=Capsicum annuum TaxID=4072 RepID=A0A2G2ZM43_CAPAN|nr:hypothetical protein T459_11500 [Capsicum annuum]